MNKIYLILLTVFLNLGLFSCTPTTLPNSTQEPLACCGHGGDIPPEDEDEEEEDEEEGDEEE